MSRFPTMLADDPAVSEAADEALVPIREISRITGVNTVTLRAWERRFGLLKPKRTHKGHRLYSRADLELVQHIQKWLARGLAISKVNSILKNQGDTVELDVIDSVWTELVAEFSELISDFQRKPLVRKLEELFALYPVEMLADKLLIPLVQHYNHQGAANGARLAFFKNLLLEQIYFAHSKSRQLPASNCCLILSVSARDLRIPGLLLSYSLLLNQCHSECLHYLPLDEALIAGKALAADFLVITGYESMDASALQLFLSHWVEKMEKPVLLVGPVAQVYRATFGELFAGIFCVDTLAEAITWFKNLKRQRPGDLGGEYADLLGEG